MQSPYYRGLAYRLRADAHCWRDEASPLDALARATAHLENEAADAIEQLLKDCNEDEHDGARSRQV